MVRRYFTLRCIGMHLTLAVLLPAFAALTIWQYDRATSGNTLSWAYTFEWPLFGGYAIYVWWQLIHDDPTERREALEASDADADVTGAGAGAGGAAVGQDGDPAPVRVRPEDVPGWALGEAKGRRASAGATPVTAPRGRAAVSAVLAVDDATDDVDPADADADPADADPALAAYNRYLADLRASDAAPVERRRRHGAAR